MDVEDSWETRDWESETIAKPRVKRNYELVEHELGEWEHDSVPDLPDDFPRLIVNLTRVQRHHFPADKLEEGDRGIMTVFDLVKNALQQHFSSLAEVLFEQKLLFHCTYGTSRAFMDGLHTAYPDDVFAMVDYPTEINDVPLHEYLHTLSYPSKWKSVEYLKDCLRRCSRDIKWKTDVMRELEVLAEQEFARFDEKQRQLSDEIDELTRLRDSFREKLEKMTRQEGKFKGQYMMLRKLEDIENRLMLLLDTFLKEPELEAEECYGAFGNSSGGVTTGMNVLDMVIAMVFSRLPRDFSQQTTTEAHFQMLLDHHIHILRLWKKDFGRLPPKSRIEHQDASKGDAERISHESIEEEVKQGADRPIVDQVSDNEVNDDWECNRNQEFEKRNDRKKTQQEDDSDGYGADFDSDESEGEGEDEDENKSENESALVKESPRLQRASSSGADIVSTRVEQRRRRRIKPTKGFKKQHKDQVKKDEIDRETALFQPYACTGGVGLLRLAKEKEMF